MPRTNTLQPQDEDIGEFEKLLRIDKHDLDNEIIKQPELYYKASQQHVLECSRRDQYYDEIKRTKASLSEDYRQDCIDEGIKVTEGAILSHVESHEDYRKVMMRHRKAAYRADQWGAMRDSFNQRQYMLTKVTDLFVAGYYQRSSRRGSEAGVREHKAEVNKERVRDKRRPLKPLRARDG